MQNKRLVHALSTKQNEAFEHIAVNFRRIEEDRDAMAKQTEDNLMQTVRQQQVIIDALNKVEEKLDRLETTQHPKVIFQSFDRTSPKKPFEIYSSSKSKIKIRSRSSERSICRTGSTMKYYSSSSDPFKKRLNESVDRFYDKTKRSSVEHRNVERY